MLYQYYIDDVEFIGYVITFTIRHKKYIGEIKENLIAQLTAPVRWTQSIQQMIADGATEFIEVGPGKVLQGLMRSIDRNVTASKAVFLA